MLRGRATSAAVLCALAFPGAASAHVGRTLPVATNFTARIVTRVPSLDAKAVDGDQTLWLRVPAAETVDVPGILGEPMLRFDRRGVWLNLHSPTAQSDKIDRFDLRPLADPHAQPLWHRVTTAHAYAWHEHRLHILEPLARGRGSAGTLGPWEVPVVVDGRRLALRGVLDFHPPGPTWAWVAASVAAAVAAAAAAYRSRTVLVSLALAAVPLVWAVRVGRELYGRPDVPVVGDVEIALTCVVGVLLLFGLTRRDSGTRVFSAFLAGFGALYEGLTMFPLLTHAVALSALPSMVARLAEAAILAAGVGALVGSVLGHLRHPVPGAA